MKAKLLAMTFCLCLMAVSVDKPVPVRVEPVEIMTIEQLTGLINEAVLNMYLQGEL